MLSVYSSDNWSLLAIVRISIRFVLVKFLFLPDPAIVGSASCRTQHLRQLHITLISQLTSVCITCLILVYVSPVRHAPKDIGASPISRPKSQ